MLTRNIAEKAACLRTVSAGQQGCGSPGTNHDGKVAGGAGCGYIADDDQAERELEKPVYPAELAPLQLHYNEQVIQIHNGMNAKLLAYIVDRLYPSNCLKTNLGLELCCVNFPLL